MDPQVLLLARPREEAQGCEAVDHEDSGITTRPWLKAEGELVEVSAMCARGLTLSPLGILFSSRQCMPPQMLAWFPHQV